MFEGMPILAAMIMVPFFSALILLFIDAQNAHVEKNARLVSIFSAVVSLLASFGAMTVYANEGQGAFMFKETYGLEVVQGFQIDLGVDALSLSLIALTNFLFVLVHVLGETEKQRYREYAILMLLTQGLLIAFFSARDLLFFYILFEAVLIPLFFIIGIWGGIERMYAAFKFFLMTFVGSLSFLIALLVIYQKYQTFNFGILKTAMIDNPQSPWLWWAIFITFAIKIPMFFLHTWLPNAHVEAPTTASMILAGILLKLGGYGMIRCILDLMPYLTFNFSEIVRILSIVAILYGAIVALAQTDMKRMVAYASIGHMGFVTLGLFNLNKHGLSGAVFQMISHGIISAGMFMGVGLLYERLHTRDLKSFRGLTIRHPFLIGCIGVYVFGLIGLPGTCGFLGELLVYMSTAEVNYIYLLFVAMGTVIAAGYGLNFLKVVAFGGEKLPDTYEEKKQEWNEYFPLGAIAFAIVWLGLFPNALMQFYDRSLHKISVEYRVIPESLDHV